MRFIARVLGPALFVFAIAACTACAGPAMGDTAINSPGHASQCKTSGSQCRWDAQCCSGRCYADTGCSG